MTMSHQHPFGLEQGLDAALHLLDRQVLDADGGLACKVDDVELTEREARSPSPACSSGRQPCCPGSAAVRWRGCGR